MELDLVVIKKDIIKAIYNCSQRGLYQTVKWLSELNHSLKHVKLNANEIPKYEESEDEIEDYMVAKSYFDCKEYDRCAYYLKDCKSCRSRFLYYYSSYLSIEKKRMDNMADSNSSRDPKGDKELRDLSSSLFKDCYTKKGDGYLLFLYGMMIKKLDASYLATDYLIQSVKAEPMLWCSWFELGKMVDDFSILPNHWMKNFFIAYACLEQLRNDEALQICEKLMLGGFSNNLFILSQLAICYHNNRQLDRAIRMFQTVMEIDPYRLDNLDIYSNLLYVQEMKTELAQLANNVVNIDRYRVETCCVVGNYYSLRSEHQKAVLYFKRALKLNPRFLSAWTLMGHEYMEMKNTNAAIQSYRKAIEINSSDYRAWYGLGQTYEILKMYFYSINYYKQASQLKPNDSRMIIAVGEIYERLDKIENALKCYFKACSVGDVEGVALIRLAKLYDKLNDTENAAAAFTEFCLREERNKDKAYEEQTDFFNALQYLASYHLNKGQLDDAYTYACKCLECDETKEQGKALLKEIAAKRVEHFNEIDLGHANRNPSEVANSSDMNFSDMNMEN